MRRMYDTQEIKDMAHKNWVQEETRHEVSLGDDFVTIESGSCYINTRQAVEQGIYTFIVNCDAIIAQGGGEIDSVFVEFGGYLPVYDGRLAAIEYNFDIEDNDGSYAYLDLVSGITKFAVFVDDNGVLYLISNFAT